MNKLYLLVKDKETKRTWFKYFEKESQMDDYKRRLKYLKNLLILEDSRDIIYY